MYLTHLSLHNFRNYKRLELSPARGVSLLVGGNAQGKTNLLEAIHVLATTRAARGGGEAEVIRREASADGVDAARVGGQAERRRGPVAVEIVVAGRTGSDVRGGERASKRFRVNGVQRRASEVIGQIAAVLFTASDIDLITGPPAGRRRYLDITISQTDGHYVRALQRYTRVLLQRNHLLRRIDEGDANVDELAFWDAELVREGATIVHTRRQTLQALSLAARDYHRRLSGGHENLDVTYAPQTPVENNESPTVADIASMLRNELARVQRHEIPAGVSLVGPHRDDLHFDLDGVPLAAYGSRAQQRTAALALRLAETAYLAAVDEDPPVLLLDDILSELDADRRHAVLELLGATDQVFVTTPDLDRFGEEFLAGATIYEVQSGSLVPLLGTA